VCWFSGWRRKGVDPWKSICCVLNGWWIRWGKWQRLQIDSYGLQVFRLYCWDVSRVAPLNYPMSLSDLLSCNIKYKNKWE
jgi:hypothetical protein